METILLGAIGVVVVILAAVLFAPSAEPRTTTVTYNDEDDKDDESVASYGDTSLAPLMPVVEYPVAVGDSVYAEFHLWTFDEDETRDRYAIIGHFSDFNYRVISYAAWLPVIGVGDAGVTLDASSIICTTDVTDDWRQITRIRTRVHAHWSRFTSGRWDRVVINDQYALDPFTRYERRAQYGDMS